MQYPSAQSQRDESELLNSPSEMWGRLELLHAHFDEMRNWRICWHEWRFRKLRAAFNMTQDFCKLSIILIY